MTTLPYSEWCKKEQAELAQVHKDYLARLDADKAIRAKYAAISEEYKQKHLAHLKQG